MFFTLDRIENTNIAVMISDDNKKTDVVTDMISGEIREGNVYTEVNGIYYQYVQREFERMKREGKMRDELDSDFMAYIYITISFNVAMYFERTMPGAPFEQKYDLCNQVYQMLQHGMFQCEDKNLITDSNIEGGN